MSGALVASRALLRSRDVATSGLAILSFAVPQAMLLSVTAGALAFQGRADEGGPVGPEIGGVYVGLAIFAAILLVVPILTMGAAASRLGMSRRAERLAVLRLIGLSAGGARLACVLDTVAHAAVGALAGVVLYVCALPIWTLFTFQGLPLSVSEMVLGPAWIAAESLLLVLLGAASAWIAVRRASISPLGVARRQEANRASAKAAAAIGAIFAFWLLGGTLLRMAPEAVGTAMVFLILFVVFSGINAVGAWSVGLLGRIMARRARRPGALLAGRRLADDPKSVWRSFAAVALVGFIAGCVYPITGALATGATTPEDALLMTDLRTGIGLTLGMSVALAAVSTAVAQASRLVDTIGEVRSLVKAGAPMRVLDEARRREILLPALLLVGGSTCVGLVFLAPVGLAVTGPVALAKALLALGIFLVASLAVIVAASEATRPMRARLLAEESAPRE
ncbi:ABC transporter permease family protein [Actinomyces culturomici]|uniref:ABC transporter permease n=1 Tax=Actinomyces culturomici TaxID=1926276 RepID=UPI000E20C0C4|nr:ABC transporter permease [Actinomyces culturomici]